MTTPTPPANAEAKAVAKPVPEDEFVRDLISRWYECAPYGEQVPPELPKLLTRFCNKHGLLNEEGMSDAFHDAVDGDPILELFECIFATAAKFAVTRLANAIYDRDEETLKLIDIQPLGALSVPENEPNPECEYQHIVHPNQGGRMVFVSTTEHLSPTPTAQPTPDGPTAQEVEDANRDVGDSCWCVSPTGGFSCTRTPGHRGPHVAGNGTGSARHWSSVPTAGDSMDVHYAELKAENAVLRAALGIDPDWTVPKQTPQFSSILVDRPGGRARISPATDNEQALAHALAAAEQERNKAVEFAKESDNGKWQRMKVAENESDDLRAELEKVRKTAVELVTAAETKAGAMEELNALCAMELRRVIAGKEWMPIEPSFKTAYRRSFQALTPEQRAAHEAAYPRPAEDDWVDEGTESIAGLRARADFAEAAIIQLPHETDCKEMRDKLSLEDLRKGVCKCWKAAYRHVWLPTGLPPAPSVASEKEGQRELKCPPSCGHSAREHKAFDMGLSAGESGHEVSNPHNDSELRIAWDWGYSVGRINRRETP